MSPAQKHQTIGDHHHLNRYSQEEDSNPRSASPPRLGRGDYCQWHMDLSVAQKGSAGGTFAAGSDCSCSCKEYSYRQAGA